MYLQTLGVRDDCLLLQVAHEPVAVVRTDHVRRRKERHKSSCNNTTANTVRHCKNDDNPTSKIVADFMCSKPNIFFELSIHSKQHLDFRRDFFQPKELFKRLYMLSALQHHFVCVF